MRFTHQTFHREITGPITHQQRNVRLLDSEDLACLRLRKMTALDDAVDLRRQPGLEKLLFRSQHADRIVGRYCSRTEMADSSSAVAHHESRPTLCARRGPKNRASCSSRSDRYLVADANQILAVFDDRIAALKFHAQLRPLPRKTRRAGNACAPGRDRTVRCRSVQR